MKSILDKPEHRQELLEKGVLILSQYSIRDTAASLQALYAKTAALSTQDRQLYLLSATS
jgi:hypothetical protein